MAAVATAGCVSTDVKMLGAARPARPSDCHPAMFPSRQPDYPFADVAYVSCDANWMMGQSACMDELQEQACALGGDTLYGFNQSQGNNNTGIAATVAYRTSAARPATPSAATPASSCTPICSPGFDCQAGQCVPLCNPACAPTEICNRHRTCEPKPPMPPGAGAHP